MSNSLGPFAIRMNKRHRIGDTESWLHEVHLEATFQSLRKPREMLM